MRKNKTRAKSKPSRSKSPRSKSQRGTSVKRPKVKLPVIPGSDKWVAAPIDATMRKKMTALLIIDMQNDFLAGGTLAVPGGNLVISKINKLRKLYDTVVVSQDWHPAGHVSFGSTHNAPLFSMNNGQMMWPDHCVQNTTGAKLHKDLQVKKSDINIKKGTNPDIDAYSAFFDNDHKSQTKLHAKLSALGIKNLDICGLAFDYCVGSTALDARSLGYKVRIIKPATASVSKKSELHMIERLKSAGVDIAI
jgi:nicotinamidase/pyrazinamidase